MTLNKSVRPKNPNGFEKFFKSASVTIKGDGFTIYILQDTNLTSAAFIAKKFMPLSVDRHRLKRRVQELLTPYADTHSVLVRLTKKVDPEINLDWIRMQLDKNIGVQSASDVPSVF